MSPQDATADRLRRRARMHAALADPQRLAMVEELLLGDRSPGWFGDHWGAASNLLAHHTGVLVAAGLVVRHPSEADRRRVYLSLTEDGRSLVAPPRIAGPERVVFVCTHNSARSQFAEALWRCRSAIPAASGGTEPAARVHPVARRIAARHGVELPHAVPKRVPADALPGAFVLTVCDHADQHTPAPHHHWSVPDPVARGGEAAFEAAWAQIAGRVAELAATLHREGA